MTAASQILEIPEVRARFSPVTVAQYHQFPELNENGRHTELIRGVVIEKMPKSPLHASIGKLLYDGLHAQMPPGLSVRQDQPLTLRDSEPEPDIAIVRGVVEDYRMAHSSTAALIIEIAINSQALDREKATLYAQAGVEEYWIVLPVERRVEIYRRPEGGVFSDLATTEGNAMLESSVLPSIQVSLSRIFT